jgi:hypothetical protein
MSDDNGGDFALMAWIKRDQAEKEEHAEKMAVKNQKDDLQYLELLKDCFKRKLSKKEYIMCCNMLRYKATGKNFSPAQRSVIASIAYKKIG